MRIGSSGCKGQSNTGVSERNGQLLNCVKWENVGIGVAVVMRIGSSGRNWQSLRKQARGMVAGHIQ